VAGIGRCPVVKLTWFLTGLLAAGPSVASAQFVPATGSPFSAQGGSPAAVAVADFNGDGFPDIAIADSATNTVTILLGNGTGGFTADAPPSSPTVPLSFPVGITPVAIVAADFNKDSKVDLAVADSGSNSVTVLLGDGTGNFPASLSSSYTAGTDPVAIAVIGLNTAKPGLAIANATSNNVTVLQGDGKGGFTAAQYSPFPVRSHPVAIAAADFNLDGIPDLAVADQLDGSLTILLGNSAGGYAPSSASPIPINPAGQNTSKALPNALAVADFNGDLVPDLVVANPGANTVLVFLGDGKGGFTPAANNPFSLAGTGPSSVAAADFNADGKQDFAVVNNAGNVVVMLGNGTGGFVPAPGSPYAVGPSPRSIATGVFGPNAKVSLAVANSGNNTVSVLMNQFSGPVVVNAASGVSPVAAGSLVSIYGTNLGASPTPAASSTLPLTLGGVAAVITDSDNVPSFLPLAYVSATQINAQIPLSVASGAANITVSVGSATQSTVAAINALAPGLFAANENGTGVAVAELLTNTANGFQIATPAFQCPGSPAPCIPVALSVADSPVLVLYGTGIRNAAPGTVTVSVGGASIPASFFGPAGLVPGVDQINATLPPSLASSGIVGVSVSATTSGGTTVTSNVVSVFIQ
jgi:uncharacterized protein (TIGR03437 family)